MIDPAVFDSAYLQPLHWTALLLLVLGLILIIAEAALPSFGAIGASGIIVFTVGGIMLLDADIPGLTIHPSYLISAVLLGVLVVLGLVWLAIKSHKKRVVSGEEGLVGQTGHVLSIDPDATYALILGERWRVIADHPLAVGDIVRVKHVDGLTLRVSSPAKPSSHTG